MRCYCCGFDKALGFQIDFLGEPKFICEACEAIAHRGQKSIPRVECSRPWALAIDRQKSAADNRFGGK